MEEKMEKMLFLMLFLLILGAANVTSQVRIGGNGQPNGAAVLDLNATDAINNGTKTLALPRVSLTSTTDNLSNATLLNGMLVYNTNTTSGAGVYYWDTNKWIKVSEGAFTENDGVIGNEFADTIPGGGLTKSGAGTAGDPLKVGLIPADSGQVLEFDGARWKPVPTYTIDTMRVYCGACDTLKSGSVTEITFEWRKGCTRSNSWIGEVNQVGSYIVVKRNNSIIFRKQSDTRGNIYTVVICLVKKGA